MVGEVTGRRGGALCLVLVVLAGLSAPLAVQAGGGPENLLIIIDPANAESKYIGNYYKNARNVPDSNVIYMDPGASSYAAFAADNLDALFGMLANRGISDHIDYILIPPGGNFFVPSAGLVGDIGCTGAGTINRISISSAYTLAHISGDILGGGLTVLDLNQYHSTSDTARGFDHNTLWLGGAPSTNPSAKQYFIGFMLGYSGLRGNTLDEIIAMIDRSVAADGTRPTGTFYYMKTTDTLRSNPRDPHFPAAIAAIQALGGQAVQLNAVLPAGQHDCLGVMTGAASPQIDTTDMTLLPGSFCDHLTSFAGTFDTASQTKMSRWIAKGFPATGASGSMGTVQEPCVIGAGNTWKFPHPRLHVWYFQGVSLGEALLRSIKRTPFECLFYGDPLTRLFAYIPTVDVPDAPVGPVSGTITLTPVASTAKPGAAIASHRLYVDGLLNSTVSDGAAFSLNTTLLADGTHDVRVVSFDNTLVASQGRWVGQIAVNNAARSVTLSVSAATLPPFDRSTLFFAALNATGGAVSEVRLLQNGRVLGAAAGATGDFELLGEVFGGGTVRLVAEALFADGQRALSAPVLLSVSFNGVAAPAGDCDGDGVFSLLPDLACFVDALLGTDTFPPGGIARSDLNGDGAADGMDVQRFANLALGINTPPVAYDYTKFVPAVQPVLVELPAGDAEDATLTYTVLATPAQATLTGTGSTRLLRPFVGATGTDTMTFRVNDGTANSNIATITIRYSN